MIDLPSGSWPSPLRYLYDIITIAKVKRAAAPPADRLLRGRLLEQDARARRWWSWSCPRGFGVGLRPSMNRPPKTTWSWMGSGAYFDMGPVGGFIWRRLDGRPLTDIVSELIQEFGLEVEIARRDLREFVGQLMDAGLAELCGGA
jgi:hypothetical protein